MNDRDFTMVRVVGYTSTFDTTLTKVDPSLLLEGDHVYLVDTREIENDNIISFYVGAISPDINDVLHITHYDFDIGFRIMGDGLRVLHMQTLHTYYVYAMLSTDIALNTAKQTVVTVINVKEGDPEFIMSFHKLFFEDVRVGDYLVEGDRISRILKVRHDDLHIVLGDKVRNYEEYSGKDIYSTIK